MRWYLLLVLLLILSGFSIAALPPPPPPTPSLDTIDVDLDNPPSSGPPDYTPPPDYDAGNNSSGSDNSAGESSTDLNQSNTTETNTVESLPDHGTDTKQEENIPNKINVLTLLLVVLGLLLAFGALAYWFLTNKKHHLEKQTTNISLPPVNDSPKPIPIIQSFDPDAFLSDSRAKGLSYKEVWVELVRRGYDTAEADKMIKNYK